MKNILIIATGGTIASKRTETGLSPLMTVEEMLAFVPEIRKTANVGVVQPMNLDSTNISPSDWLVMEKCIEENYDRYDGFVILHGTDTMAYTAAALSYLVQDSPKPIVVTGAQRPIDMEVTDAKTNFTDSVRYAVSPAAKGVSLVFDGRVICGTRAKKTRSKSFNAFSSINFPYLAVVSGEKVIDYGIGRVACARPIFYDKLNPSVGLFKLIPGVKEELLDYYFLLHDVVVIESFGVGGIPEGDRFGFYDVIAKWRERGKVTVVCTQVMSEGSDMSVYRVGVRGKEEYGLMESYDMTPEAVVTKLMWASAVAKNRSELEKLFYKTINNDILCE